MAYADAHGSGQKKALTGGAVALLQGGLAVAVISGLAVTDFAPPPKQPPLAGEQIKLTPLPPEPTKEPETLPSAQPLPDSRLTAPPLAPPLRTDRHIDVAPSDPGPPPTSELIAKAEFFVPPVTPTRPAQRFTPRDAAPRGNISGWVTTDDYPSAELRAGHQGAVRFRLSIDTQGRVSDCAIVRSSGYARLDEATCKYASRRARFDAATDGNGDRVAGTWTSEVRWMIPDD